MICESCSKYEATVSYTHIVESKKTTVHLCNFCASNEQEAQAAAPAKPSPEKKVVIELSQLLPKEGAETIHCPVCGMTYAEFKKAGRFGCQECYPTFGMQLERLLKRIHGSTLSKGKELASGRVLPAAKIEQLQQELAAAVSEEAFERAAQLRDRILQLENALGDKSQ